MKVTFVLPCYAWSPIGGFRVVYEYANRLADRGHEVAVVHPRRLRAGQPAPGGVGRRVSALRTRIREWLTRPTIWWHPIDPRVRLLYVAEPDARRVPDGDVVFATAWQTAGYVAAYPASKGRGFYLVQDFHPWLGPRERIEASWRLPLRKVAVSAWLRDQAAAADPAGAAHVPIGVIRPALARRVHPRERKPVVAMMCSDAPYKALDVAFHALALARRRRPDLEAVAFGSPPRPAALPAWAEYVRRPGEEELAAIYNRASVFVCSSAAEGFALPPAEAMACGCAVVTTDCGGNREYAEDGVTALVSPPGDAAALAANLVRCLDDDELRLRLAESGHDRVRRFTWERSTELLEACIAARAGAA